MSKPIFEKAACPLPPGKEVTTLAFLIAHALRNGKELHVNRDGTAEFVRVVDSRT